MEYGLSLGSNLGDRLDFLMQARACVSNIVGVSGILHSPVYETEAVGVRLEHKDMAYLNAVLVVQSELTPAELSDAIHAIEARLGRVRTEDRFAPRPIDIDILYAGQTMMDDEALTLPHPRWAERRFVAQPLADIKPDLVFPGDRKTVHEVLDTLPEEPAVALFATDW